MHRSHRPALSGFFCIWLGERDRCAGRKAAGATRSGAQAMKALWLARSARSEGGMPSRVEGKPAQLAQSIPSDAAYLHRMQRSHEPASSGFFRIWLGERIDSSPMVRAEPSAAWRARGSAATARRASGRRPRSNPVDQISMHWCRPLRSDSTVSACPGESNRAPGSKKFKIF